MIRGRAIARRFGDKRVIDGLDVEVAAGDFLLVTGPNGSGKSTLLRAIAGLQPPRTGAIRFQGRDLPPGAGPQCAWRNPACISEP